MMIYKLMRKMAKHHSPKPPERKGKLWCWEGGRLGTGYRKFMLFFSTFLKCDAYLLHLPVGVDIPSHRDRVPGFRHFRMNITIKGHVFMEADGDVTRMGNWFSFFRPDKLVHWAEAPQKDTYILSIGWLRQHDTNTQ